MGVTSACGCAHCFFLTLKQTPRKAPSDASGIFREGGVNRWVELGLHLPDGLTDFHNIKTVLHYCQFIRSNETKLFHYLKCTVILRVCVSCRVIIKEMRWQCPDSASTGVICVHNSPN